ncbi:MAG: hypothetical protein KKD77_22880 [Gammaproteobacteria bacterium]|nr:hypothetical protein [Gammaproteobacteria bacterium]
MEREEISLNDSVFDVVKTMSEGNPGAISVLMQIMKKDEQFGLIHILCLDDMNIRGTQIWIGYKDFSGSDIDVFIENIKTRNPEMISLINEHGRKGNHQWKAVDSGASRSRQKLSQENLGYKPF